MKATAFVLLALAGIVALGQAQPAPKQVKTLLDAIEVGDWVTLGPRRDGAEFVEVEVISKPADLTIRQRLEQAQKARKLLGELVQKRNALPRDKQAEVEVEVKAAANVAGIHGDAPFEVTSIGDDHIVVTDGQYERFVSKQAIRWINRRLPE